MSDQQEATVSATVVVWYRLVDAKGGRYKKSTSTSIKIPASTSVDEFRKIVTAEHARNILKDVAASCLKVYKDINDIKRQRQMEETAAAAAYFEIEDFFLDPTDTLPVPPPKEPLIVHVDIPDNNEMHGNILREVPTQCPRPRWFFTNDDERWKKYLQYGPERNLEVEGFVDAVRNATVCCSKPLVLKKNGLLVLKRNGDTENLNPAPFVFVDTLSDLNSIRIDPIEFNPNDFNSDDMDINIGTGDGNQKDDCARVIYMVRLPLPIPILGSDEEDAKEGEEEEDEEEEEEELASDTLYVTCDHLRMFPVLRKLKRSILTGNPGIGKSWYQWEYLVYLLKPALYQALASLSATVNANATFSGLPVAARENKKAPRVVLMHNAGARTTEVLFLSESPVVCHTVQGADITFLCMLFNSRTALMMFEPGRSMDPVPYEKLKRIRILATVSPDVSRYKEFKKHGGFPCYMPCPAHGELLSACAYIRPRVHGTPLEDVYTHKETLDRIDELGPFTRYALPSSKRTVEVAYSDRQQAIDVLTLEHLSRLVKMQSIEKIDNTAPVSHWFLRYDVDRTHDASPYGPASAFLRSSSRSTVQMVRSRHLEVDVADKIVALIKFDNACGAGDHHFCRTWLEDVFAERGTKGLKWTSLHSERFVYDTADIASVKLKSKQSRSEEVTIKFSKFVYDELVPYSSMVDDIIYVNMKEDFPFIDGVWKHDCQLYAFQAMTGPSHPKKADTFISALKELKVEDSNLEMTIFYVMMPYQFKKLEGLFPERAFFWKSVEASEKDICENVIGKGRLKKLTLCILRPPNDFRTGLPESQRQGFWNWRGFLMDFFK